MGTRPGRDDEEPRRERDEPQPDYARGQHGDEPDTDGPDVASGQRQDEINPHEGSFAEGQEDLEHHPEETDHGDFARGQRRADPDHR